MKEQIPSQLHSLLPPKPIPNESFELHQSVHSLLPFITGKTRVECSAVRSELFRMLPNESSGIRLKVLLQSILVASSKTLGHFDIISNRYLPLLMELSGDLSIEDERRTGCVLDLREFWMYSAMHVSYFVGRYLDLKLVSRINVLNAFIPDIQQDIVDGMHKLMRIDTWECVRSLVVRVFLAVTVAKKELATVAFEGSLATEGEAEIIAERIAQARFNVKERSNECEELITIAFSSLLMTFDRIVKYHKLQMSEQELDASLIRVLEWRISGMAREIARRDTEMCSIALIAFKESDVTAFETKTFELYEELKRIASSNLLKSEKP
uniref:MIF4G-like type 2 domain-containing protein n=1 Tax=Timspurckia oligopyrenoides TaxID=708627 RepID=A0A7S0ZE86_9RHOD